MKTTQRSLHRRARLALLAGVVLMAALAVAATLLFRADDPDPSEMESAQEPSVRETAKSETGKATAPDATAGGAQETEPGQEKKPPELNSRPEIQTAPDDMPGIERWTYDPSVSKKMNRIRKYLYDQYGSSDIHRKENGRTPRGVIEILVEGMDDMAAAEYLYSSDWGIRGEKWPLEKEYAIEYANRVLAKDPTSLETLILKADANVDAVESARLLIQHYPDNEMAVSVAVDNLYRDFPEETISAISRILPEDGLHSRSKFHLLLGNAYERLDMMYEAADQFQKAFAAGDRWASYRYDLLERGERAFPSIWEERAAAAAESVKQTPQPAEASGQPTQRSPDAPTPPETPRGVEPPPPPPNLEAEMFAAYANFAKAYQSAFEMEYSLSEATPEGYMNALLGMARAFAKAGDAQHAQDAYNAARKRYSPEEIQQAFRRFDEQDRLRREASNAEKDSGGDDEADE